MEAQHEEPKEQKNQKNFLCVVTDVFRIWAQGTSVVLGSAWVFAIAMLTIAMWGATGSAFHYSDTWQLIINTGTTVVTFLMVFLVQNTQNRDAKATQLKLDEIIRAVSGARNELMNLEKLSDEDLTKLEKQFTRVRERAERNIGSDGCAPVGESKRGPDEL